MRIIAGTARGTILQTLEGTEITRPTLDRVKESLFSILLNWLPDAEVLDLFSGSGALGLEAISRGAKNAILNDKSRKATQVIKANVNKLKMNDKIQILEQDYLHALNTVKTKKFDIIFLDPPYKTDYDIEAIKIIKNEKMLTNDGIIVLETDSDEKINKLNDLDIKIIKAKKYGRVKLVFLN